MVTSTESACIKGAGKEGIGTRSTFSGSAWVGVALADAINAYTEDTYAKNASCARGAFVINTCTVVAGIGNGYVEDSCVKDSSAIRDIHIRDTSAVRDNCFRDTSTIRDADAVTDARFTYASAVNDTCFKDTDANRNICFRDVGAVNRLGIHSQ